MKNHRNSFGKFLFSFLFISPFVLASCSSIKPEATSSMTSVVKKDVNSISANSEDINLYRLIGVNYVCIAREAKIEFPKAIAIASTNFAAIIEKKHGGLIDFVGSEKLSLVDIYQGSYLQLIEGAINLCPDKVPENEKEKFNEVLKKIDAKNKKL